MIDEPANPLANVRWRGRAALFWAQLPWLKIVTALAALLVSVASLALTNRTALLARFDAFVTRKVLTKMRAKLAGDVFVGAVKVRVAGGTARSPWRTSRWATPARARSSTSFLVAMKRVHVKLNPLSILGVRGRGNFVVGYLCGEVDVMSVTADGVVDEVPARGRHGLDEEGPQLPEPEAAERGGRRWRTQERQRRRRRRCSCCRRRSASRRRRRSDSRRRTRTARCLCSDLVAIARCWTRASWKIEKQLAEVNKRAESLGSSVAGADPSRGRGRHEQAQRAHHVCSSA